MHMHVCAWGWVWVHVSVFVFASVFMFVFVFMCACVPIANCPVMGVIQPMLCLCLWHFSEVLCTHSFSKKGMVRGSRLHYGSALCLSLVLLGIWNVQRRIAHLSPRVADYYRLVTA